MALTFASNKEATRSNGLQPSSDGLLPNSDGLQPKGDGLQDRKISVLSVSLPFFDSHFSCRPSSRSFSVLSFFTLKIQNEVTSSRGLEVWTSFLLRSKSGVSSSVFCGDMFYALPGHDTHACSAATANLADRMVANRAISRFWRVVGWNAQTAMLKRQTALVLDGLYSFLTWIARDVSSS